MITHAFGCVLMGLGKYLPVPHRQVVAVEAALRPKQQRLSHELVRAHLTCAQIQIFRFKKT